MAGWWFNVSQNPGGMGFLTDPLLGDLRESAELTVDQNYIMRKKAEKPKLYHLEDMDISDEKREEDRLARAGGGGG